MFETSSSVNFTQILIPAASGLAGVTIGGWITLLGQRLSRKNDRLREQLKEFYSPLLGVRSQIKAKSDVRLKITAKARELWPDKFAEASTAESRKKLHGEESAAFKKMLDYNNTQLVDELVPLYRQMLDHVTYHMWLAEPSTIEHYTALVEYVEIWNRFLDHSIPQQVLLDIEHDESSLFPFYEDLKQNFERITRELKSDNPMDVWQ
jgi:hypothetical protein